MTDLVQQIDASTQGYQQCLMGFHAWVPWLELRGDDGTLHSFVTWCARRGCDHQEVYRRGCDHQEVYRGTDQ